MTKRDEPQELAPIDDSMMLDITNKKFDVSDLLWKTRDEGMIPLKMMTDQHLRNTALMLIGMGYQVYNSDDRTKLLWLTALRLEWEKRMRERRATKTH